MVSCCSGGLAVRRATAWYYVLGVREDAFYYIAYIEDARSNTNKIRQICPSLSLSVCISSAPTGRIFLQFDVGDFNKILLSNSVFVVSDRHNGHCK
jgi:hypothetical protein